VSRAPRFVESGVLLVRLLKEDFRLSKAVTDRTLDDQILKEACS
jgi:hypothetical protein